MRVLNPLKGYLQAGPVAGSTHEKERGLLTNSNADPSAHLISAPILKAT